MTTPTPSPRVPTLSRRGESAAAVPQTVEAAPPIPTIGGFLLAAIAHIKPPKGLVQS